MWVFGTLELPKMFISVNTIIQMKMGLVCKLYTDHLNQNPQSCWASRFWNPLVIQHAIIESCMETCVMSSAGFYMCWMTWFQIQLSTDRFTWMTLNNCNKLLSVIWVSCCIFRRHDGVSGTHISNKALAMFPVCWNFLKSSQIVFSFGTFVTWNHIWKLLFVGSKTVI